jgi:uncharacterized protein (TIGR00369 family)
MSNVTKEQQSDIRGGNLNLMPRSSRDSELTLAVAMNPADANPLGNVHGGVIMKLVDEAGGLCAIRYARRPTVTIAIDSMTFHSPVRIGNLLSLRARVNWVGRTSMEIGVRVEAENVMTGQVTHTNSAYAVYIALDDNGQPMAVPPLWLEDDEARRRWDEGAERQKIRLQRAHRV